MIPCRSARQADDGRATFRSTAVGQLRIALGNNCVVASGSGLAIQDCSIAGQSEKSADKFLFVAVPEFDPTSADAARTSAGLAIKTASRLEGLLSRLDKSIPCMQGHLLKNKGWKATPPDKDSLKHSITAKSLVHKESNVEAAIESMVGQLNIGGLANIIERARATLGDFRGKF